MVEVLHGFWQSENIQDETPVKQLIETSHYVDIAAQTKAEESTIQSNDNKLNRRQKQERLIKQRVEPLAETSPLELTSQEPEVASDLNNQTINLNLLRGSAICMKKKSLHSKASSVSYTSLQTNPKYHPTINRSVSCTETSQPKDFMKLESVSAYNVEITEVNPDEANLLGRKLTEGERKSFKNGATMVMQKRGFKIKRISHFPLYEVHARWLTRTLEREKSKIAIACAPKALYVTIYQPQRMQVNLTKTGKDKIKFELESDFILHITLNEDTEFMKQQHYSDPDFQSVFEEASDTNRQDIARFGRVTLASHPRKCRVDGCDYCLVTNNGLCLQCEHEVKHGTRGLHGHTISTRTQQSSIGLSHLISRSLLDRYLHPILSTRRTEPTANQSDIAVDSSLPMSSNMNSELNCQETEVHDLSNTFETPAICLKYICKNRAAKNALNFCEDCFREFQASRSTECIKS
ncbi:uncharacterized protein LOC100180377 [Ciona intestinalis]